MKQNLRIPQSNDLKDPEPISFALNLFAALTGAAGLIIQTSQYVKKKKTEKNEVRKQLYVIDRSLNRIDEAYRSLISIFDEYNCLGAKFSLGACPIFANESLRKELSRLQANIFYGGRELNDALTELSVLVNEEDSQLALEFTRELEAIFRHAMNSEHMIEFMIDLGMMLHEITKFIYSLGEIYKFEPTSVRINLIRDTIHQLKSKYK